MVHVSIVNADAAFPLSYCRGKGLAERAGRMSGLSYAILRFSALFGLDDILLNNIAWAVRRFPVVLPPGRGDYRQTLEDKEESPHWETARDQENVHLDAALSTGFSDRMLRIAGGSSGMFAVLTLVKILSGKVPSKLAAKERRAAPMAGIFASGDAVSLSAAPYSVPPEGKTRIPEPKPGYARLDQALDTSDCDGDLTLVFVVKPNGDPGVLILKLPMSTEGGAVLRINRDDEKKLRSFGYHSTPSMTAASIPTSTDGRKAAAPSSPT